MSFSRLVARLESEHRKFTRSYRGMSAEAMVEPGVTGQWSVKDLVAHVATWEEESLKALPLMVEGRRPPLYRGIDRFNAEQSAWRRGLGLKTVIEQAEETHRRLLAYLMTVPEPFLEKETRVRRRLRLDTYKHYGEHAASVRAWRKARWL